MNNCCINTTLATVATLVQEPPPLSFENNRGEGVYFSGKRYTQMNTAERAAYRKSLIDDYVLQVEISD